MTITTEKITIMVRRISGPIAKEGT
jgi:hypothetical protein